MSAAIWALVFLSIGSHWKLLAFIGRTPHESGIESRDLAV
jgi:hypothetical protein